MKKSSKNGAAKKKQTYELKPTTASKGTKATGCPWEGSSGAVSASFEVLESSSSVCLFLFLLSGELAKAG
jgi:hypothetical protein